MVPSTPEIKGGGKLAALPCAPDRVDDFISTPTPRVIEVLRRAPGPFLVLGAGGKIGLHLCMMLRQGLDELGRKDRVLAVSRFSSLRATAAFARHGIETQICDLASPEGLARVGDAPTVFFLVGVKFGTAGAPEFLRKINVGVPQRVAERFAQSRLVAFSSGCVYPFVTPGSGGAREDTPTHAVGDYAASCIAREETFTRMAREAGASVALVRLNYAVEFRYGLLVDIAQRVYARQPIDVTTGYINVIWQNDAVAHSIQALEVAASPAVPINITGAEILAVRDVAHRFGRVLGVPVEIVGSEADTAWLNDASQSHALFGAPRVSVDEMVEWISAWLQRGGETWGKPTAYDRRDGRF